jgi:hypothetical protein
MQEGLRRRNGQTQANYEFCYTNFDSKLAAREWASLIIRQPTFGRVFQVPDVLLTALQVVREVTGLLQHCLVAGINGDGEGSIEGEVPFLLSLHDLNPATVCNSETQSARSKNAEVLKRVEIFIRR